MIFQSLGSNYSYRYAWRHLFATGSTDSSTKLSTQLAAAYGGEVFLYARGRHALAAALAATGSTAVALNGITCSVVPEAALAAGSTLHFIDIDEKTGNMSLQKLEHTLKDNSHIKAVVIQNTFGNMIDIAKVEQLAKKYTFSIIEDLAHSVGQTYADGRLAGTVGDAVMLSFGRDKIIDAVNGGALVIRNSALSSNITSPKLLPSRMQQFRDRIYPLLTCVIRSTYAVGLGKLILMTALKTKLIPRSADGGIHPDEILPHWQAKLIHQQLGTLAENMTHRQAIMSIYADILESKLINSEGSIRGVILAEQREELLASLANKGFQLQDTWYDTPIGPTRKYHQFHYPEKQNSHAVAFTDTVINLPTHIYISDGVAKQIAQHIKEFSS
ncbi:MAG TPA: aminotransferase class V-fold PLP-dependent enzyme [Candidatus Saccharibacteria bacterium]|nr:aminotransferase class V-fold PLP-dependent enzyme [Candidatus Saccharibacteria bacterium]HMR38658.1 aminotransferase class V-fold PLP-dependent enzyme [Candidatus Saccharibacteria bacterium]